MLRISILCRLAVQHGFFANEKLNQVLDDYKAAIAKEPTLPFMHWALRTNLLTREQSQVLKNGFPAVPLSCLSCEHSFQAGDVPMSQPLVCPKCGSAELVLQQPGTDGKPIAAMNKTLLEVGGASSPANPAIGTIMNTPGTPLSSDSKAGSGPKKTMVESTTGSTSQPGLAGPQGGSSGVKDALTGSGALPPEDELGVIPPGTVIGGCRIIQKVGQGGMGAVYKAHHIALDKPVALKILSPHLIQNQAQILRFIREARSAAKLEHHNIVQVLNVGEEQGRFFLVMQWVDGKSLQKLLDQEGVLSLETAVKFITQAARGLAEAHKKNIIHRDVKPDNLMLTDDGVVKVADFGLAKQQEGDLKVSMDGVILGTPYYMSPEQGQNNNVDHRADIYSLGITLYQLITGKVPFTGQSAVQIIFKHIREPLTPPKRLLTHMPEELNDIIIKMTAKEADERYQTMDEVVEALEGVMPLLTGKAKIAVRPDGESEAASVQPTMARTVTGGSTSAENTALAANMTALAAGMKGLTVTAGPGGQPIVVLQQKSSAGLVALVVVLLLLAVAGGGGVYYLYVLKPQLDAQNSTVNRGTPNPTPNSATNASANNQATVIPDITNQSANAANNSSSTGSTQTNIANSGNGSGNQPINANSANQPDTNAGNTAGNNMPIGPSQAEVRLSLARSRFDELRREWGVRANDPANFAILIRRFEGLKSEFADVPQLNSEVDSQVAQIREKLHQLAADWLAERRTVLDAAKADLKFTEAEKVLKEWPEYFAGTPTAEAVAAELRDMQPALEKERKATRLLRELEQMIEQALLQTVSEGVVMLAKRKLEELQAADYADTWCATRIPDLQKQIGELDIRARGAKLEGAFAALTSEVTRYLGSKQYRFAMKRLLDERHQYAGTVYESKVADIERNIRDEADRQWQNVKTQADVLGEAGNYKEMLPLLAAVADWGLPQQVAAAEKARNEFIASFVSKKLSEAQTARDGDKGLKLCAEFLGYPGFVSQRAVIEQFRTRFELMKSGMMPVIVPDGKVLSPDGKQTWDIGDFFIDRNEVTNAEFYEFVKAGGYQKEEFWSKEGWEERKNLVAPYPDGWRDGKYAPGMEKMPVTGISYFEAEAYAKWVGKRLPTMQEWIVAAGFDPALKDGAGGFRVYPWGERFKPQGRIPANVPHEGVVRPKAAPVGSFKDDVSAFGCEDMGGNVREWTSTPSQRQVLICGGYFAGESADSESRAKVTFNEPGFKFNRDAHTGFRCVKTVSR